MKKFIYLAILATFIFNNKVFAYPNVAVQNTTPFDILVNVEFVSCSPDYGVPVPPGATSNIKRGPLNACLIKKVWADVREERVGGEQVAGRNKVITKRTQNTYESSGTSYSQFLVAGPVFDATGNSQYIISRKVD